MMYRAGKIGVEEGLWSNRQLADALELQRKLRHEQINIRLAELMVEQGIIRLKDYFLLMAKLPDKGRKELPARELVGARLVFLPPTEESRIMSRLEKKLTPRLRRDLMSLMSYVNQRGVPVSPLRMLMYANLVPVSYVYGFIARERKKYWWKIPLPI